MGTIEEDQRVEQVDSMRVAHAVPNELFIDNGTEQLPQCVVQMGPNGDLRPAGVGDGGNDIAFVYDGAWVDTGQGNGVRIDGNSPAAFFFDIHLFDNDRLTQVIRKYGADYAGGHGRYAGTLVKAAYLAGIVLVQREVETLMGKVAPAEVTPPLVR